MRQILFFCLAFQFSISSSAQYIDSSKLTLATDYLKKSNKQKTAAWILLGGGAGLTAIGVIVGVSTIWEEILEGDSRSSTAVGITMAAGLVSMASSIPLFIAAGKNRRRAAAGVSLKMEKTTIINQWVVFPMRYPAIAIHIRL